MVDAAADAEGENARVGVALHLGQDLQIVAHLAIGHETDHARALRRIAGGKRCAYGLHHFGAAAAVPRVEKLVRPAAILRCGRHRIGEQDVGVACERDEVEGVARMQPVQRQPHRLLGFLDGEARHGAGRVEHEHQFLGRDLFGLDAVGRLQQQREVARVGEHGILNPVARNTVLEDEILVRDDRLVA